MKRMLVCLAYLGLFSAAVAISAWLGYTDGQASRQTARDVQLNTSMQRQGLKEGEVLIWAPGQGGGPPAPAPRGVRQARSAGGRAPTPVPVDTDPYNFTRRLLPLAKPLGTPRRGEWRSQVQEPEQDFQQFLGEVRKPRGALIVLPVGDLPNHQTAAIGHVLDAMSAFFGMPTAAASPMRLDVMPVSCFRSVRGRRQINAEALMNTVLGPYVRGDVAGILAVTANDLYPGEKWPFESAFGWSSFNQGTAVVSTYQTMPGSAANREKNLLRLCKLAVHEMSHTFGLKHCATYNCLLNGCGSLRENDAKPFALCPDCLAKLSIATGRSPEQHLADMHELCRAKGFTSEARYYARAVERVR